MRTIQLTEADCMSEAAGDILAARMINLEGTAEVYEGVESTPWAGALHVVRNESVTILKPDGSPLLIYLKDVLPRNMMSKAFGTFKLMSAVSYNRGTAAGVVEVGEDASTLDHDPGMISGARFNPIKRDGSVSNTGYSRPVNSGVAGAYPRYPRIPYCRLTAFTLEHEEEWREALPYMQHVSKLFKEYMPARWQAQQEIIARTTPDFYIPGTVFTTVTVNRSWRTSVHKDAGDYAPGFGVMAAMEGGKYDGCELIFPRFRSAVDMRTGGLCLADVHEWHGSAPLRVQPGNFRLSLVFYYRADMEKCGTPEEERQRADEWQTNFQMKRAAEASAGQLPAPEPEPKEEPKMTKPPSGDLFDMFKPAGAPTERVEPRETTTSNPTPVHEFVAQASTSPEPDDFKAELSAALFVVDAYAEDAKRAIPEVLAAIQKALRLIEKRLAK